jgi:hypothetical protein
VLFTMVMRRVVMMVHRPAMMMSQAVVRVHIVVVAVVRRVAWHWRLSSLAERRR